MTEDAALFDAIEGQLGVEIAGARPVAGGDIADSLCLELADGRLLFAKRYASAARGPRGTVGTPTGRGRPIAIAEAQGLAWLAEAGAIPVARCLAAGNDWLALDWIESAAPARDFDVRLGRGLAALHQATPDGFGLAHDTWIGRIPQDNRPCPDWPTFYAERRIAPLAQRARDAAQIDGAISLRLDRLIARLPALSGPDEPPSRLHGDLWTGNVMVDAAGGPCLIDPAVYAGHREVDLAMMRLFGGFGPRVFAAYEEAFPLTSGAEARVPLYQLLPLLVHVCLFGRSYVAALEEAIDRALAI